MATETVTGPTSAPRRRFTLPDGTILVAATAVGFAVVPTFVRWYGLRGDLFGQMREIWAERAFAEMAALFYLLAPPVLAAWTVALIPLRLLKARPRFRRLARQPGLMAGIAVTLAIGFMGLLGGIFSATNPSRDYVFLMYYLPPAILGLAVLVAWTTLVVGGRWRPEPSWVDRLGWAIGVCWVLLGLASPFV